MEEKVKIEKVDISKYRTKEVEPKVKVAPRFTCTPFKSSFSTFEGGKMQLKSTSRCGPHSIELNFGKGGVIGLEINKGGHTIMSADGFDQDKVKNELVLHGVKGSTDASVKNMLKSAFNVKEVKV